MLSLVKTRVVILVACIAGVSASPLPPMPRKARRSAPGARPTIVFSPAFILTDGGHAQAAYLSGEHEDNASWTWDGSTLKITRRPSTWTVSPGV